MITEQNRPVLEHWYAFVEKFLVNKESYLIPYQGNILTSENLEAVLKRYNSANLPSDEGGQPDHEKRLLRQFADASKEEKIIYLHAEWVYRTPTENTVEGKLEKLNRWKADGIESAEQFVFKGFAKLGAYYSHAYRPTRFILELFKHLLGHDDWLEEFHKNKQDSHDLCPPIDRINKFCTDNGYNNYRISSVIKFFNDPEHYEPIITTNIKQQIVEHYQYCLSESEKATSEGDIDKRLLLIRQRLRQQRGN